MSMYLRYVKEQIVRFWNWTDKETKLAIIWFISIMALLVSGQYCYWNYSDFAGMGLLIGGLLDFLIPIAVIVIHYHYSNYQIWKQNKKEDKEREERYQSSLNPKETEVKKP